MSLPQDPANPQAPLSDPIPPSVRLPAEALYSHVGGRPALLAEGPQVAAWLAGGSGAEA
jgi:hypothetical protein